MKKLFFHTAPAEWMEGLPIGNGRLAGMVWGNKSDQLTLNHEWLWTGRNKNREVPDVARYLPLVREFIRKGDPYTATALANSIFGGKGGISGLPGRVDDYQPAGELRLDFDGEAVLETRELDIQTGIATICRRLGENSVSSEFLPIVSDSVSGRAGKACSHFQRNSRFHERLKKIQIFLYPLKTIC